MWIASRYLQPKWYLLTCTHFDASRYYACRFMCILVWTEEKVLWLILQRWFLPFVICSPNFIIHFHLRDDAHVNIPVQTPQFRNRPTSPPSRKSTATLKRNAFQRAHHCKSAPFWRNSCHYFLICRRSNCSEWILNYKASLLHYVRNVEVTVDSPRYLRDDPSSVV
jgi:hypothetical protein